MLLVDLISEPVHPERRRSLPLSLLAKPVDSVTVFVRQQTMQFLLSRCQSLENQQLFFQQSSLFLFAKFY